MPAIAFGINAAASVVSLALRSIFPDFPLTHEGMPDFARQRRFVMIHREHVDAETLARLAKAHLNRESTWADIGDFLEEYVRSCLVNQARAFAHPPLLRRIEVGKDEDPSDAYFD